MFLGQFYQPILAHGHTVDVLVSACIPGNKEYEIAEQKLIGVDIGHTVGRR